MKMLQKVLLTGTEIWLGSKCKVLKLDEIEFWSVFQPQSENDIKKRREHIMQEIINTFNILQYIKPIFHKILHLSYIFLEYLIFKKLSRIFQKLLLFYLRIA